MRKAVRAIIVKDNNLLVMHRNKFGHEYFTLIGGRIDLGETADQALVREVQEETGMVFDNPRLVFVEEAGDPYGTQYIYLCDFVSGEPILNPASTEATIHAMGQNLYEPTWLPIKDLPNSPFLSEDLKQSIIAGLQNGFPDQPQTINTEAKLV